MSGSRCLSCRHRGFPLKAVAVLPALSVPGSVRAARPERAAQTGGRGRACGRSCPFLVVGEGARLARQNAFSLQRCFPLRGVYLGGRPLTPVLRLHDAQVPSGFHLLGWSRLAQSLGPPLNLCQGKDPGLGSKSIRSPAPPGQRGRPRGCTGSPSASPAQPCVLAQAAPRGFMMSVSVGGDSALEDP